MKKQNEENPKLLLGVKGAVGWTLPEMCDIWVKKEQRMPPKFEVRTPGNFVSQNLSAN